MNSKTPHFHPSGGILKTFVLNRRFWSFDCNAADMLTVEKIGGTSMSALHKVIENVILFERKGEARYNRIFVVSAFSGVTDLLLEGKKTGKPGVYTALKGDLIFMKCS